jgi:nucleotide-binding universal stress UspA family protein
MPQVRKILVPVDFSVSSTRAFEHALALASRFGSSVHVLHAWEVPAYLRPDLTVWAGEVSATLAEHAAREATKSMTEFLALAAPAHQVTSAVVAGPPYETIIATAKEGAFDLIAMGTHGRTGLTHLVLGSVAEKVVRHAECPVLTVRSAH